MKGDFGLEVKWLAGTENLGIYSQSSCDLKNDKKFSKAFRA